MGIPHILYDPIYTDSAQSSASPLTPAQIQLDNTVLNLSNQASDVTTLGLMIVGGGVSKGIQSLGAAKLLPLAGQSRFVSTLFKTGITGASIAGESATFVVGERGMNVAFFGGDSSQLNWKGENGIEKAWKTSFINFAGFRFGGKVFANQNGILQVFGNSSTLVAANQLTGALGFTPVSHDDLSTQMIHSTLTYLQMQSSGQLLHVISPSSAQTTFDLTRYLEIPRPIRIMSDVSSKMGLPVFRSGEGMGWAERSSLESLQAGLAQAAPKGFSWFRFNFLLRFLGPEGKLNFTQNLLDVLRGSESSENSINFALSALPKTFRDLPLEQKAALIDQVKDAFRDSHNPNFRLRHLFVLQQMLPSLVGPARLTANRLFLEAAINPYQEVSQQADSVLSRSISKLSRSDLMQLGSHLKTLEFVPQIAGKKVRDLLTLIAYEIDQRPVESPSDSEAVARWYGQFIAHPEYRLGTSAARDWLILLRKLPPERALALVEEFKNKFDDNLSGALHWANTSDTALRDRSVPLDNVSKAWYTKRRNLAVAQFKSILMSLELPQEWTTLSRKISSISNLEEALEVQESFQKRMRSNEPHARSIVENWWQSIPIDQRWKALQILVGPEQYLEMKGEEAMRWRKLASMGVPYETGIASTQNKITDNSEAIFLLGNFNSIGLPESFIERLGAERALQFSIIHHTHPVFDNIKDLKEIYPSSFMEGQGGGDLSVLFNYFKDLKEGEEVALSVTHPIGGSSEFSFVTQFNAYGGSLFVLRKIMGAPIIDIYSGIRERSPFNRYTLDNPLLVDKRSEIRKWAESRQVDIHFYEIPYDWVESIQYPTLTERTVQTPLVREISH